MPPRRNTSVKGLKEIQRNLAKAASFMTTGGYQDLLWELGGIMRQRCQEELQRAVYDTPPGEYERTGFLMVTIYREIQGRDDFDQRTAQGMILARALKRGAALGEYQTIRDNTPVKVNELKLAAGAIYAERVEYGPHVRGARPFMRPAMDKNARYFVSFLENRIRSNLSQLATAQPRSALGRFVRRIFGG